MMSRVPGEDVEEVQADWKKASFAEKKQMVWDANANPHPHPTEKHVLHKFVFM